MVIDIFDIYTVNYLLALPNLIYVYNGLCMQWGFIMLILVSFADSVRFLVHILVFTRDVYRYDSQRHAPQS